MFCDACGFTGFFNKAESVMMCRRWQRILRHDGFRASLVAELSAAEA